MRKLMQENDALEQKNAQLECELAEAKIKINSLLMVGPEKETTRLECEVEAAHKETERVSRVALSFPPNP